ncbi:DUF4180 domain-containing protein [Aminipila sp.]|uniref:DUF4180 domain-containing protein n=1 Tax=Aminipila sp. TaxID=2060095 RepID=UPI001D8DE7DE|nr:DUF4180 domain-containing protein [Aminipila sp.]MBE6035929.1 DUF4180 domain-containing protein [Clostridiales bacterium]
MGVKIIEKNNTRIAYIEDDQLLITDVQSCLDFIASVSYETGCNQMVINKSALTEDFFRLDTCLAGEILQKFVTYQVKLAVVGDYSSYTSKSLKDFIYESNRGKDVFFVASLDEAVAKLAAV